MSDTIVLSLMIIALALISWANQGRLERQIKVLQRRVFDLENPHLAKPEAQR